MGEAGCSRSSSSCTGKAVAGWAHTPGRSWHLQGQASCVGTRKHTLHPAEVPCFMVAGSRYNAGLSPSDSCPNGRLRSMKYMRIGDLLIMGATAAIVYHSRSTARAQGGGLGTLFQLALIGASGLTSAPPACQHCLHTRLASG